MPNPRYRATGLNATPRWLWVYFTDSRLVIPATRAVQVPWGLVTPEYQSICDGINAEVARRMEAQAKLEQLPLPLERWE